MNTSHSKNHTKENTPQQRYKQRFNVKGGGIMNLSNLKLNLANVLSSDKFILVEQTEKTRFDKDGKPTSDTYVVADVTSIESGFEKISVRLEGSGLNLTNNEILESNTNLAFVYVDFVDDEVKLYTDFKTGEHKITAKAKSIRLIPNDEIEL